MKHLRFFALLSSLLSASISSFASDRGFFFNEPDSSVKAGLGEHFAAPIFSPDTVKSLLLNPLKEAKKGVPPYDGRHTIKKVYQGEQGDLQIYYERILNVLRDSSTYIFTELQRRTPFVPEAVFELSKKEQKIKLYFFLSGEEIGISEGGKLHRFIITRSEEIRDILSGIYPREKMFRRAKKKKQQ